MSFTQFVSLSLQQQLRLLQAQGSPVLSIRYYRHKITLYLWKGHYIEVFFNHKIGAVEKVAACEGYLARINFYADQIQLSETLWDRNAPNSVN